MPSIKIIRTFAVLALIAAPAAQAQSRAAASVSDAQARQGLTLGLGLGAGQNGYSCTGCGTERRNGGSAFLTIGDAITPSVVLAGEVNAWTREESGTTYATAFVGPTVQWYPSVTGGFFFKGGAGLGSVRVKDNTALSQDELTSRGFGYQVGMGYDLGITRRFALTPYVGYMGMTSSNATINGQSQNESLNGNFWHYGVGLTWR